jgi:homoserine kinase
VASVRVCAPASSANLGPGFDVLAAALDLRMELEVEETGGFEVVTDLSIARDRRNLCVRGFTALRTAEGARFTIRSEIPLSGGLGTSAAAYVAGLTAADALNGGGADVLGHAARLEGHPDNAAAALLGRSGSRRPAGCRRYWSCRTARSAPRRRAPRCQRRSRCPRPCST